MNLLNRSSAIDFNFINCELNHVFLEDSKLDNFEFKESKLCNVSFVRSFVNNLKIKTSTLEKIEFYKMHVCKDIYKKDILTVECNEIKNYDTFLKEINV